MVCKKGETIIFVSIGGKVLLTRFNPDIAFDAKTLEMLANGNTGVPSATATADQKEAAPEETPETTSLHEPNDSDGYSNFMRADIGCDTNESKSNESL